MEHSGILYLGPTSGRSLLSHRPMAQSARLSRESTIVTALPIVSIVLGDIAVNVPALQQVVATSLVLVRCLTSRYDQHFRCVRCIACDGADVGLDFSPLLEHPRTTRTSCRYPRVEPVILPQTSLAFPRHPTASEYYELQVAIHLRYGRVIVVNKIGWATTMRCTSNATVTLLRYEIIVSKEVCNMQGTSKLTLC